MAERIMLYVMLDLDPVPGRLHTPESAKDTVEAILLERVGQYTPVVLLHEK